jgi:arsenical pump membrane protein
MVIVALKLLSFPILTIVSLMIITLIAERAGVFNLLAQSMAVAGGGNGRRLFAYIFACGTITGMLFTNDAAVLIFTPLVFQLVERVQGDSWTLRNKIPFYFAVLYVANLVGALVTSNPINIVVASLFHISFLEYARWMFLPAAASILVTFAGLALVFRKSVPRTYECPAFTAMTQDRLQLALCALVLCATLAGFFTESLTGIPTWLVACAGALILLGIHATTGKGDVPSVIRGVSWDVLIFVTGIFVVVMGLRRVGLTEQIGRLLSSLVGSGTSAMTFGTSLLAAASSSVLNNHPTAYMMGFAIRDLSTAAFQTKTLAFAALIGGDLGPKMLPIGSLAALIWFRLLRDRGVHVPYSLYIKIGIPVTIAAIVAAVMVLNVEIALFS